MKKNTDQNPCLSCPTNQGCCSNLLGLALSQEEYESLFFQYKDLLDIDIAGRITNISVKDGKSCPYWDRDHCSVYLQRPMECRLYPFSLENIYDKGETVYISFGANNSCPLQEKLIMSKSDAKKMILEFTKKVYPDAKKIKIEHNGNYYKTKNWLRKNVVNKILQN